MPLTFGSLCSGIGGLDLGLEWAGLTCWWQVEKDPYCLKILSKNWPHVRKFEDIHHVGHENLQTVDLICGGIPCQPHSLAGKRRGAADDRDLWPQNYRIVEEMRPRYVLVENVLGIRTTILDQMLFDLEALEYTAETFVIPACGLNAPHKRDRIFILAYAQRMFRKFTVAEGNTRKKSKIPPGNGSGSISNPNSPRLQELNPARFASEAGQLAGVCDTGDVSDTHRNGCYQMEQSNSRGAKSQKTGGSTAQQSGSGEWWATEPGVGRVAHGVPNRVDRIRVLGQAVVPQVAQLIGEIIIQFHKASLNAKRD